MRRGSSKVVPTQLDVVDDVIVVDNKGLLPLACLATPMLLRFAEKRASRPEGVLAPHFRTSLGPWG